VTGTDAAAVVALLTTNTPRQLKIRTNLVDVVESRMVEIVTNARCEQDECFQVANLCWKIQTPNDSVHLFKKKNNNNFLN
jgi:hypothetical protein